MAVVNAPDIARIWNGASRLREVWRCSRCLCPWWEVAAAYARIKQPEFPVAVRTRGGSVLRLNDRSEITTLWHIYCAEEYRLPREAQTIVDLGANIGAFALFAAEHCKASRIIAVEPFPSTFARLQQMLQENQLEERIRTVQVAIGSSAGYVRMNAQANGHTYARRVVEHGLSETLEVQAITLASLLDQFDLENVDLLKVDIEGSEYAMVESCPREVLRRCRTIAMEYHDARRRQSLWDRLQQAGFRCTSHRPQGWSGLAEFQRV